MVAAAPDKWIWDLYKEFKFRIKDIRTFEISSSAEDKHTIVCQLESGQRAVIDTFERADRCQIWIDNFIKENL